MRPPKGDSLPYPDAMPVARIQDYLYRVTGTLLTPYRIGLAINAGDIKVFRRNRRHGGGRFTRKVWLDDFISANS